MNYSSSTLIRTENALIWVFFAIALGMILSMSTYSPVMPSIPDVLGSLG